MERDISYIIGAVYLAGLSFLDVRYRKLPLYLLLPGIGAAAVCRLAVQTESWGSAAAGGAVGIGFLLVSRITGQAFGYGDGLVILALGIFAGLWNLLGILVSAFGLTALFGGALLVRKKFHRKTALPFLPFLTAGYLIMFLSGIC